MNRVVREGFTEVILKPTLEEGEGESRKAPQEEGIAGTGRSSSKNMIGIWGSSEVGAGAQ